MTKKPQSINLHNKKISLNFIDVDIVVIKPDFANDNLTDCYGQYLQRENAIQINAGLETHDLLNTVIHEIFHSCVYVSGLTQKDNPRIITPDFSSKR